MTCHSDTGKIKTLFIKNVQQAFINDAHIEQHWKELNYLGIPSLDKAIEEYADFESILKKQGADIFYFPEDDAVNMDSVYCRDAAVATDAGMILCNMGKEARKQEPLAQRKAFEANGFKILGSITAPGTLEGGDVAWLDEHTLAVGHGYRTNAEGIRQLSDLLKPLNVEVITVPLPHYKGPSDVFHLMSILSPVDTKLAVIYSPLMPVVFRELLLQRGYGLVEVPDEEFDSMGCNVLAMAPGNCLMVDGNPITKAALEKAGCTVSAGQRIRIHRRVAGGQRTCGWSCNICGLAGRAGAEAG